MILARNYGKTGATWSDGDFDADGKVDFNDLVTLARNYGRTIPGATAAGAVNAAALAPASGVGPLDVWHRLVRRAARRTA